MGQVVTRNITTCGRWPFGGLALLVLMLAPVGVQALVQPRLRDLADPVPAGGVIPYRITLVDQSAPVPTAPVCFNPPSECATFPVTCNNPPPTCSGSPIAGYVCENSANNGTNCGVGSPPVADPSLCIASATPNGVCDGGPNIGLQCTAPDGMLTTQCPGLTFLCKRAFNENAYCGLATSASPECVGDESTGFFCRNAQNEGASCATPDGTEANSALCQPSGIPQARPENTFCLSNPSGICSGGPNFGLTCNSPHGFATAQCPPDPAPLPPSNVLVEMPLLPGTTFVDADNGGTSNGSLVSWTLPPLTLCGGTGEPQCPQLNANLLIDALVPEGTAFQNTATATDQDGFVISAPHLTTVARFLLRALTLSYPLSDDRDRFTYRSVFTLLASESIDPGNEEFIFNVSTPDGTLVEFVLAPGFLPESSIGTWSFNSREPGLKSVRLKQIGPGHYNLKVRAARMALPDVTNLNATVTITIGDVVLTHPARFLVKRGGRRFVAARSTTTTTIVSPGTTTTSVFGVTTSTSITTSSTLGTSTTSSTTLDSTTTSTTLDTTTTTIDTTTTTIDTTTTTIDTTTTTIDTTTTTIDTTTTTIDTTTTTIDTTTTTIDTTTTTIDTTTTTLDTTTTSSTLEPTTTSTSSTTSSTLLPCGGLFPACAGDCPIGQTCTAAAVDDPCTCQ